jgi:hypothetical protein
MNRITRLRFRRPLATAVALGLTIAALITMHTRLAGQGSTGFPDGYDAVQAAPKSHRVLFENAFVRVLEVVVPPGTKEPMHHHRWPSLFFRWDTGGRTAHQRYYRADGSVHDMPSQERPEHEGTWHVTWMEPEPMHAIENAETAESALTLPKNPPTVRVELKFMK